MSSQERWRRVGGPAAAVYQRLLVPAMFAPWAPALLDLAAVRRGERILDAACGTGVVTRLAAARTGPTGTVVGLDLNPAMLAVARAVPPIAGAPIDWVEASVVAMPFPAAAFDVVLCQHGLQQVPDRLAALREMRRVAVIGGRLAVCVWGPLAGSPGMAALAAALARHVGNEAAANRRAPFALGDAGQVADLLTAAGWRNVDIQTLVKTARFPSAAAMVAAQLAATPLATLGAMTEATRQAVTQTVDATLVSFVDAEGLAVPMEAHLALARA